MDAATAADPDKGQIGRNIREIREEKHISQQQLATRLGIDRRQLSEWENGRVGAPRVHTLRRIALALGVTLDELADPNR